MSNWNFFKRVDKKEQNDVRNDTPNSAQYSEQNNLQNSFFKNLILQSNYSKSLELTTRTFFNLFANKTYLQLFSILILSVTLFNSALSLQAATATSTKSSFNNYDQSKIKYTSDKPKTVEHSESESKSESESETNTSASNTTQTSISNTVQTSTSNQSEQTKPVLPANQLIIQSSGCYYVSRISNDGAGGKLYLVGNDSNLLDKLISDNYNNLTTSTFTTPLTSSSTSTSSTSTTSSSGNTSITSPLLLGKFSVGQNIVLKITPFYSQSPKTILSTDSSRVKQTILPANSPLNKTNNTAYSLAFEDWLDYDFNDIILRIEKGECEDETPATPNSPTPPTTTTPTTPALPTTPTNPNSPTPPTITTQPNNPPVVKDTPVKPETPTLPTETSTPTTPSNPTLPNNSTTSTPPSLPTPPNSSTPQATKIAATPLPPSTSLLATTSISGTPLPTSCSSPAPYDQWCGEYYNNNPYTGVMTSSQTFPRVRDFLYLDWGAGGPAYTSPDYFTAKFSKNQWFDGDYYQFTTSYDDGMKLYIDGVLIMDSWNGSAGRATTKTGVANGWHLLEVYYKENTGLANLNVSWELACNPTSPASFSNWCAEYYNNNPYTGVLTSSQTFPRNRDFLYLDWGIYGPAYTPVDNFTAKVIKNQWFEGGYYKFNTTYDDGMKLAIDGAVVIDRWNDSGSSTYVRMDVSRGWHFLEVNYREKTGLANINVSWELACKEGNNFSDWCVEFYNNNNFDGIPVKPVTKTGDYWNENWGDNNPTINLNNNNTNSFYGTYLNDQYGIKTLNSDYFSGYFTKMTRFSQGYHTFTTSADDGAELIIDGVTIIRQSGCCSTNQATIYLSDGWHLMQVKYREDAGKATYSLKWEVADKTPPIGFITNPPTTANSPANKMNITGNSFTVTANAYDTGNYQSGIASVDFYATYDNSLKLLGSSYNAGGVPNYTATLDLTKLSKYNTGNQDIELSITVKDKAGNVSNNAGGSRWVGYSPNNNLEEQFTVNDGNGNTSTASLRIENNNVTSNPTALKASYSTSGQNRNVWIVSHGMNNDRSNLSDVSNALISQTSDIVISLDWSGARGVISPNQTDQWIRPTAKGVADKLKSWGITNGSKLNMVGHSMGTIMSTEIAKAVRDRGIQGDVTNLIYLDPPNIASGVPGILQFDVDDTENTIDSIYNDNYGYQYHYPSTNSTRMQAFTGINYKGEPNTCGNANLNKTAKENITIFMPEVTTICGVHGGVHFTWSNLISNKKLAINNLEINKVGVTNFQRKDYFQNNEQMQATIFATGSDPNYEIPDNIMYFNSSTNQFEQEGRTNDINQFNNLNNFSALTSNKQTIVVKGFEGGDKVSLMEENTLSSSSSNKSIYRVENTGSEVRLYRAIKNCAYGICGGGDPEYLDMKFVNGVGLVNITQSNLSNKNQSYFNFRNF